MGVISMGYHERDAANVSRVNTLRSEGMVPLVVQRDLLSSPDSLLAFSVLLGIGIRTRSSPTLRGLLDLNSLILLGLALNRNLSWNRSSSGLGGCAACRRGGCLGLCGGFRCSGRRRSSECGLGGLRGCGCSGVRGGRGLRLVLFGLLALEETPEGLLHRVHSVECCGRDVSDSETREE